MLGRYVDVGPGAPAATPPRPVEADASGHEPIATTVKPFDIARGTPGFSGADLANLVNEAALFAARRNRQKITMQDMEDAKDKIMMGAERRSMVMSDKEKEITAYHAVDRKSVV